MWHVNLRRLAKLMGFNVNKRRPDEDFTCPKCGAAYKIVRIPAPGDFPDRRLHCKICSQEFAPTDEANILKYFLVGRRRRSQPAHEAEKQVAEAHDISDTLRSRLVAIREDL